MAWAFVLLAGLAAHARAQPLSEHMLSDFAPFGANHSGLIIRPSSDPADALRLNAVAQFDTAGKTVSFFWSFYPDGGPPGDKTVVHDVSYQPTAICRKNGYGPTLFVAGYLERHSRVIIEAWTFENIAMGTAMNPVNGVATPTLTMSISKEVLAITDGIGPVFGVAYHPDANDLWIFEDPSPRAVFKVDLDEPMGEPTFQFDALSEGWPALESAGRITTGWIKSNAPDGGGFIILGLGARNWRRLPTPDVCPVFMLRDRDHDGAFEDVVQGTYTEVLLDRSYDVFEHKLYP